MSTMENQANTEKTPETSAEKQLSPGARERLQKVIIELGADRCLSCGLCVAGCPIADWNEERLDPRRAVRLIQSGIGELVALQDWIWQCSTCDRCTLTCPVGVRVGDLICALRAEVPGDRAPDALRRAAEIHKKMGNNRGIMEEDWLDTAEWMAEELEESLPGFELPVEKEGAEIYAIINGKLPMVSPEDLQDIFRIYHSAGVSWTLPGAWWDGTNYAMFTRNEAIWEETLRRQADNVHRLGCKVMAYTECGSGYYATLTGYQRFGIEVSFELVHVVNLYARWLREGRLKVDPSKNPGVLTIHDPCNAVRRPSLAGVPGIEEDARYVASRICAETVEMTPNREENHCCGGGGGVLLTGYRRARFHASEVKAKQIDRTGADIVCAPCVSCRDSLADIAAEREAIWKPYHLWKLLARALVPV